MGARGSKVGLPAATAGHFARPAGRRKAVSDHAKHRTPPNSNVNKAGRIMISEEKEEEWRHEEECVARGKL